MVGARRRHGLQSHSGCRNRRAAIVADGRPSSTCRAAVARFAWGFTLASSLVFLLAARAIRTRLCFVLAPLALAILFFYSFSKRFTLFSHLILGFCLGIAPAAAWIAMRGTLDPRILWLTAAVMFWTAGFDVIYACQDYEFDCAEGLCSIPRRFGVERRAADCACAACRDDRLPAGCW